MSIIDAYQRISNSGEKPAKQVSRWARHAVNDLRVRASTGEALTLDELDELIDTLEVSLERIHGDVK